MMMLRKSHPLAMQPVNIVIITCQLHGVIIMDVILQTNNKHKISPKLCTFCTFAVNLQ